MFHSLLMTSTACRTPVGSRIIRIHIVFSSFSGGGSSIIGSGGGAMGSAASEVAFSILTNSCPQPSSVVRQGIDDIAVLFVGA